jgi:hypothetical protein
MPDVRIKYNGVRVRLRGFGMRKLHHLRILMVGLDSIRSRLARGIGETDGPTKPLTKRYAIYKSRVTRSRSIRDLRLTGELLDGLKPRYADDTKAVADASGRKGRMKARIYRDLLRFSPQDQEAMREMAADVFAEQVEQVTQQLSSGRGAGPGRQPVGFGAPIRGQAPLRRRRLGAPLPLPA